VRWRGGVWLIAPLMSKSPRSRGAPQLVNGHSVVAT